MNAENIVSAYRYSGENRMLRFYIAVVIVSIMLSGCVSLGEQSGREGFIKTFCDGTPLGGYADKVTASLDIKRDKLKSVSATLGVEKARLLQQQLEQYNGEYELINRRAQGSCRLLADCRYYHKHEGACPEERKAFNEDMVAMDYLLADIVSFQLK